MVSHNTEHIGYAALTDPQMCATGSGRSGQEQENLAMFAAPQKEPLGDGKRPAALLIAAAVAKDVDDVLGKKRANQVF